MMVALIESGDRELSPDLPDEKPITEVSYPSKRSRSNVIISIPAMLPVMQMDWVPVREIAPTSMEENQEKDSPDRGEAVLNDSNAQSTEEESDGSPEGGLEQSIRASVSHWTRYQEAVIHRIEQGKRYPLLAQMRDMRGVVVVGFTIQAGGEATSLELIRSSQEGLLDQEALDTIRRVSPFPPLPMESGLSKFRVTVALKFNLKDQ
jgi:protein TonB